MPRIDFAGPKTDLVFDILLRLAEDEDPKVRDNAVWQGLIPIPERQREVIVRRLVDVAISEHRSGDTKRLIGKIASGLQRAEPETTAALDLILRGSDSAKAEIVRTHYKEFTGRTPPQLGRSDEERRNGYVKAFRELHEHIGAVYPNFKLKGIDWAAVGRELLPRAAAAETDREFGLLVEELVARLEDSHAWVVEGKETPPSPDLPEWGPMLACLTDDRGRAVIYHVARETDAWKAGVRPGLTVVSVNGVEAEQAIKNWMQQRRKFIGYSSDRALRYDAVRFFFRQRKRNAAVSLVLENLDGSKRKVELKADLRVWYIPRLPVPREGIDDGGGDVEWVKLKDGIGLIYVRRIKEGLELKLDQALSSLGAVKGLIIDLRGNSGGGFNPATAFQNFDLAKSDKPEPHRPHFAGPIALLIDERCISAAEGWASWFVAAKRARLFGTATAGASARKETYTLSNEMYKVQIPVKAYTGSLDRPIERRGIEPDVEVRCRASDLAGGRDTVAQSAIEWLTKSDREGAAPAGAAGKPRDD